MVKNISATDDSYPAGFSAFNGFLYFSAADDTNGNELWRTDGTSAGTTMVADINPSGPSYPFGMTALGDYLYFVASTGSYYALMRVDAANTLESETLPGTNVGFGCMCSQPLITLGGRLLVTMTSEETGQEFATLEEPTWGLPETNRDESPWTLAFAMLACATAAAGIYLRVRRSR
jgi:ELWxxDGT repeat protein